MKRGANVALTQEIPSLTGVVLGVRWNAGSEQALSENLVAATILCDADNQAPSEEYFVFFNQLTSPDLSVAQLAQALGDDREQIEVDLGAVPADIHRIVVALYVNEGPGAKRTLGQLRECYVRVLDLDGGQELVRSENLAPALRSETGDLPRRAVPALQRLEVQGHRAGIRQRDQRHRRGLRGTRCEYRSVRTRPGAQTDRSAVLASPQSAGDRAERRDRRFRQRPGHGAAARTDRPRRRST